VEIFPNEVAIIRLVPHHIILVIAKMTDVKRSSLGGSRRGRPPHVPISRGRPAAAAASPGTSI
jgi:hypothetical protein